MSRRGFVVSVLFLVLAVLSTVIFGADMFSGTWKLNIAKSTFSPGPAPKEGVGKVQAVDNGLTMVLDGVSASGQKTHTEYTVKFDGKDYPSKSTLDGKPNPNGDFMVSAKKVDDYTYETTAKLKGKVLGTSRTVVAKDGKTATVTQTGTTPDGKPVNTKLIIEKQ
jgi:hypothetical protein